MGCGILLGSDGVGNKLFEQEAVAKTLERVFPHERHNLCLRRVKELSSDALSAFDDGIYDVRRNFGRNVHLVHGALADVLLLDVACV
jgi:hypothetical protein